MDKFGIRLADMIAERIVSHQRTTTRTEEGRVDRLAELAEGRAVASVVALRARTTLDDVLPRGHLRPLPQ